MSAVGFLDGVHGQGANRVDAELFEFLVVRGLVLGSARGRMFFFARLNFYLTAHPLPPFMIASFVPPAETGLDQNEIMSNADLKVRTTRTTSALPEASVLPEPLRSGS
jgi:hypothetical protein